MSKQQLTLKKELEYELLKAERSGNDSAAASLKTSLKKLDEAIAKYKGQASAGLTQAENTVSVVTREASETVKNQIGQMSTAEERVRAEQAAKLAEAEKVQGKSANTVTTYITDTETGLTYSVKQTKDEYQQSVSQGETTFNYQTELMKDDVKTMGEKYVQENAYITYNLMNEAGGKIDSLIPSIEEIGKSFSRSISSLADDIVTANAGIKGTLTEWLNYLKMSAQDTWNSLQESAFFGFIDLVGLAFGFFEKTDDEIAEGMEKQIQLGKRVADRIFKEELTSRMEGGK